MKVSTPIWLIISIQIISKHFKMYITINDIIGETRIDLSYPIRSGKEIAVISMFCDNLQYEVLKPRTIIDNNFSGNKKLILIRTYEGRELISILEGMIELIQFVNDDRVIKMHKLNGITEMIINSNELDNTDNLEDGGPSNTLLTYHVTSNEDFTCFKPNIPQYKKLKNGEFVSLSLKITDQNGNIIIDGLQVTVVLHIRNCKS